MRSASIIINAVIFAATVALVASCFRRDGRWQPREGLHAFRYFTVLSNVLCALSALVMMIARLRGQVSGGVMLLKYLGTASVTVTMLTVLLFLGPTMGYAQLLAGRDAYMHLIGPLLAIASFCFLEKRGLTFPAALTGLAPVVLYGAVYLYKVVYAPEGKRWEDFYGFNRGGRWPLAFTCMLAGTAVVCVVLWVL